MKFIFLNGPPRCGKDTLVGELIPYLKFRHLKFAMPIKRAVAGLLDITENSLEEYKDVQSNVLQHVGTSTKEYRDTPRQLLIALSEDLLKPKYGSDIFGRVFWHHAKNSFEQVIIASDCGFVDEVQRVIYNAGKANCRLIRIQRDGCTFDGDSRSYLPDGLCPTWDLANNGTKYDFTMRALRLISREFSLALLKEPEWIK